VCTTILGLPPLDALLAQFVKDKKLALPGYSGIPNAPTLRQIVKDIKEA